LIKIIEKYELYKYDETVLGVAPVQTKLSTEKTKPRNVEPITDLSVYTVQKGDGLYSISKRSGVPIAEIRRINHLESNDIKVGQELYLKPVESQVVETIDSIAPKTDSKQPLPATTIVSTTTSVSQDTIPPVKEKESEVVIKEKPDYGKVILYRGKAYLEKKDYDKAIADFNQELTSDPKNINAYYYLGFANLVKKDYPGAITALTKGLEVKPGSSKLLGKRATAYFSNKDYKNAILDYDKLIAKKAKGKLYLNRGISKYLVKDYPNAIKDLQEAVKMKAKPGKAYYYIGLAYNKQKKTVEACKNAKEAKKLGYKRADNLIKNVCK